MSDTKEHPPILHVVDMHDEASLSAIPLFDLLSLISVLQNEALRRVHDTDALPPSDIQ